MWIKSDDQWFNSCYVKKIYMQQKVNGKDKYHEVALETCDSIEYPITSIKDEDQACEYITNPFLDRIHFSPGPFGDSV